MVLIGAIMCLVLATAPSVASKIADFARNSGRVDGFNADDLIRASSAVATGNLSDFHSRGFVNIQQTRVAAPVKGIILVWTGFSAEWDQDSDPGSYAGLLARLRVDRQVGGVPQQMEISRSTRAGTQHLALSAAIPVKSGPHRINVQLRTTRGEALTYLHQRHIETLFVPFGRKGLQGEL